MHVRLVYVCVVHNLHFSNFTYFFGFEGYVKICYLNVLCISTKLVLHSETHLQALLWVYTHTYTHTHTHTYTHTHTRMYSIIHHNTQCIQNIYLLIKHTHTHTFTLFTQSFWLSLEWISSAHKDAGISLPSCLSKRTYKREIHHWLELLDQDMPITAHTLFPAPVLSSSSTRWGWMWIVFILRAVSLLCVCVCMCVCVRVTRDWSRMCRSEIILFQFV